MILPTVIAIWVVVTVALVALSIHRSIFVTREEDTLFVSEAEGAKNSEYATIIARLRRFESMLKVFSYAAGVLTILVAVMWVYQRLYG